MKKSILFVSAVTMLLISGNTFAQEERVVEKQEIKSIKKQVILDDENGVKTLTIRTNDNGDVEEEVYTGAEAEAKMAELESQTLNSEEGPEVEVKVEEVDGVLRMKIKTIENGKVTIEEYEGAEAEAKLKELETSEPPAPKAPTKIVKEKKVIKTSNM